MVVSYSVMGVIAEQPGFVQLYKLYKETINGKMSLNLSNETVTFLFETFRCLFRTFCCHTKIKPVPNKEEFNVPLSSFIHHEEDSLV